MNTQIQHLNAAAIDRHNLVAKVRSAQAALSNDARDRFKKFAEVQAGNIYEFASASALERAFFCFEWTELDRVYAATFSALINCEAPGEKTIGPLYREARAIIRDKRQRLAAKTAGVVLRGLGKTARQLLVVVLFVVLSEITSEAILYYRH